MFYWFIVHPRHASGWRCGILFPGHAAIINPTVTLPINFPLSLLALYNPLCSSNTRCFVAGAPGMYPYLNLMASSLIWLDLISILSYIPSVHSAFSRVMSRIPRLIIWDIFSTTKADFQNMCSPLLWHGSVNSGLYNGHSFTVPIFLEQHVTLICSAL